MVLATCGVWGAYRVSKWRGPELGGIGLGGMLAVPVGRPLGGRGVPAASAQSRAPRGCRARGGGVVRGTASRAPVVSRVWRRRFEPQLKIRSCISHQASRRPSRRTPHAARVSRKTINVRRAHDTSPSAPTRTHSELMTLCDHILMVSIEGPLVLRIRTSLCARDLRAATRASPRRGRLLTTEFTPSPHPRSTLE